MNAISKPQEYYQGCNIKLFEALPAGKKKVLELGCAEGNLGQLYKQNNPDCEWIGVDVDIASLETAATKLDRVIEFNLNHYNDVDFQAIGSFDMVVFGDLIEHMLEPERLIANISEVTEENAHLVCCIPNMVNVQVARKLILGDLTYDVMGLLDNTHTRFFSPASAQKMLMDGGWIPHLQSTYDVPLPEGAFIDGLLHAAQALGVPHSTAQRNLSLYQLIYSCKKAPITCASVQDKSFPISVVYGENMPLQASENIYKSAGLQEMDAQIIPVQGARSAAEAFEYGRKAAIHDWIMYCHQDVYFPKGSGALIAQKLLQLQKRGLTKAPVGVFGIGVPDGSDVENMGMCGLIVDRGNLLDFPEGQQALCIDECVVFIHKDCVSKIDPELGWHAWGADICMQALADPTVHDPVIIRVPVFHNSVTEQKLPLNYEESVDLVGRKFPQLPEITTLNGTFRNKHYSAEVG